MKSLPKLLSLIGLILIVVSIVWWQQTFGFNLDYAKCLVVSSGICNLGAVKGFFGGASYNPLAFLIGISCLAVGILLRKRF